MSPLITYQLCVYSYFLFIFRCTPPHKSTDYQKIYSDWCNEFEKYKSAMKSWEKKQVVRHLINLIIHVHGEIDSI